MSEKVRMDRVLTLFGQARPKCCESELAMSTHKEIMQLVCELLNNRVACISAMYVQLSRYASSIMANLRCDCKKLHKT